MKKNAASFNRFFLLVAMSLMATAIVSAQNTVPDDGIAQGLTSVAAIAGETETAIEPQDSTALAIPVKEIPVWKQKLYYGYNFDIYFHHDTKTNQKENGWSISFTPEIGWKLRERIYLGLRFGGTYQDTYTTYSYIGVDDKTYTEDLRVMRGSWDVAPYVRYRLKTIFNNKVGIWLEAHLYAGMDFPRVKSGDVTGTDYDGLRHSITYGAQLSPVITYRFNRKSTFQIFFSILSLGYSGTTRCYQDALGERYNEYSNDVIIFSGKLRNLIANQFTPGLYGLKFGVQKNF
ncbi:MAG: hypothetical protein IJ776_02030 [Paludibacteraceae bacterium]|nr:hypothetical protein [Paludibacteraceae bacterium]